MSERGPKNTPEPGIRNWETFRKTPEYQKKVMSILKRDLERVLVPNLLFEAGEDIDIDEENPLVEEVLEQMGLSVADAKIMLEISELETIGDVRAYCREKKISQDAITKRIDMIERNWENISAHLESGEVWNNDWVIEFREELPQKPTKPEPIN